MQSKQPLRILHILGRLGHGGIETWLMSLLRTIDRTAYQFDFLVDCPDPQPHDDEVRQLGGQVFVCPPAQHRPRAFRRRLIQVLQEHGPYDVVHSHAQFMSGYPLRIAARYGVPKLIAHSHDDFRREHAAESLPRKLVTSLLKAWIRKYATDGLAISRFAAESMFGPNWTADPRWKILWYGFDFSRFAQLPNRRELRRRLNLPEGRIILGQVGRLVEQKNYPFSISVVRELARSDLDVHFLSVGGGPSEQSIRTQFQEAGLSDRFTLAGDQHNVAPYYGAMDCMLFPSLHEGLGIVALEAQAAGVPTVASEFVPLEASVIPGMVEYVPLSAGPAIWAEAVRGQLAKPLRSPHDAAVQMNQSDYAIQQSLQKLCAIYHGRSQSSDSQIQELSRLGNNLSTVNS